jgi:YlmC/YmxH family sporulation protein
VIEMRLSELQNKDIINVNDGKKIGNIIDVLIDSEGKMTGLIVEKSKFFISIFTNKNEFEVRWEQIDKIGDDVILVKMTL